MSIEHCWALIEDRASGGYQDAKTIGVFLSRDEANKARLAKQRERDWPASRYDHRYYSIEKVPFHQGAHLIISEATHD